MWPRVRRQVAEVETDVRARDAASDHAQRSRAVLDVEDENLSLVLDLDPGALERAPGRRGVLDEQVERASPFACVAAETLDVDAGAAQRLA